MKKILCIGLGIILFGIGVFCGRNCEKDENPDERMESYMAFLEGKEQAYFLEGAEGMYIGELLQVTGEEEYYPGWYTFFDSTGDGLPELHFKTPRTYDIYTYREGKIWIFSYRNAGTELLNTGAFLYTHDSVGQEYYEYILLDGNGNEIEQIRFLYAFTSEEEYFTFNGVEDLTREQWEILTEPYLGISSDEIEWVELGLEYPEGNPKIQ